MVGQKEEKMAKEHVNSLAFGKIERQYSTAAAKALKKITRDILASPPESSRMLYYALHVMAHRNPNSAPMTAEEWNNIKENIIYGTNDDRILRQANVLVPKEIDPAV